MISRDYITEWRASAPWVQDAQVEQDLILTRALVAIYSHPVLAAALAFRGGTALYKLHIRPPARYSEDIDLVQVHAGPAGPIMGALRGVLNPWLGSPRWKQTADRITLVYRFASEDVPPRRLRLKIEINSDEQLCVFGFQHVSLSLESRWFRGTSAILTYTLNELLATKLRALYQRKKGRDLFDLATAMDRPDADPHRIVAGFTAYMLRAGLSVTRADFERNLASKLLDQEFRADIGPLLARGHDWNIEQAAESLSTRLIAVLPARPPSPLRR